jgi:hypothetical protein
MNWPPMLIQVKIENKNHWFNLWIPLFLVYPVILVIFLILSPLLLIALIVLSLIGWEAIILLALQAPFIILWNMRGLKVDVQNRHDTVFINVV